MRQVPVSALPLLGLALLIACGDDSMVQFRALMLRRLARARYEPRS